MSLTRISHVQGKHIRTDEPQTATYSENRVRQSRGDRFNRTKSDIIQDRATQANVDEFDGEREKSIRYGLITWSVIET